MKAAEHTDIRSQFFGRAEPVLPEPTNEQRAVTPQPAPVGDSAEPLTCLPADRRTEALAIIKQDPSARAVLEDCNQGRLNCWDAMTKLGMDPWECDNRVPVEDEPFTLSA